MKTFIILCFLSSSAMAESISFKEALAIFDQSAPELTKVEVGMELLNESYEKHEGCTIKERTISTVVELREDHALVLNDQSITACDGQIKQRKFLSQDFMIKLDAFKAQITKELKDAKIDRSNNIMTFVSKIGTSHKTLQYDLNSSLFVNWVHYHHSYTGVEDHNIRFQLKNRIIPMEEVEGLPLCARNPLTLEVLGCSTELFF